MIKKLLLFLFASAQLFGQTNRKMLNGIISNNLGPLENVHIINIQTKEATNTNQDGRFRLFAKPQDSLRISSIGYKTELVTVVISDFGMTEKNIHLKKQTIELDEVVVNSNNLSGVLESDTKTTPKDKKAAALANTLDFSNVDWDAPVTDDHIDEKVRPHVVETTPSIPYFGASTKLIMPFKHSERLWALRRDLAFKKGFPKKILSEFGEDFFFKKLKIPVEKYYHFLEYCNPLGIENLYKQEKVLEVIKILQEESKSYLKIINKQ